MAEFNKLLSEPAKIAAPTAGDASAGDALKTVGMLLEGGLAIRDEVIKTDLQKNLADIQEQEQSYITEKQAIESNIRLAAEEGSTTDDYSKVNELAGQLKVLDQNEEDRKLSPVQAKVQRQKILRDYASRYPHLSPEINTLARGAGSSFTSKDAESPLDKLMKDPKYFGIPPSTIIQLSQQKVINEMSKQAGETNFPDMALQVEMSAQTTGASAFNEMVHRYQQDEVNFNPTMEKAKLDLLLQKELLDLRERVSQARKQAVRFDEAQVEEMQEAIRNQFVVAYGFIESSAKPEFINRSNNIVKANDIEAFRRQNKEMARDINVWGSDVAMKMMEIRARYAQAYKGDLKAMERDNAVLNDPLLSITIDSLPNDQRAAIAFGDIRPGAPAPNPSGELSDPANGISNSQAAANIMVAVDPELAGTEQQAKARDSVIYKAAWKMLDNRWQFTDDKERVKAVARMAFEQPAINRLVFDEAPTETISDKKLTKRGFRKTGEEVVKPASVIFDPTSQEFRYDVEVRKDTGIASRVRAGRRRNINWSNAPRNSIDRLNVNYRVLIKAQHFSTPEEREQYIEKTLKEINSAGVVGAKETQAPGPAPARAERTGEDVMGVRGGQGPTDRDTERETELKERFGAREVRDSAVNLVAKFEGFRDKPYFATEEEKKKGIRTIGFGKTEGVQEGDTVTRAEATADLQEQLAKTEQRLEEEVGPMWQTLSEGQKNAVISLAYNVDKDLGGQLKRSKALKALINGDLDTFMEEAFDREKGFVRQGGKVLPGLVNRREAERRLFARDVQQVAKKDEPKGPDVSKLEPGTYLIDGELVEIS